MKVFVSWSGELSQQIAEILKKWIPCIIQSVEIFFSTEDIEKGTNWDKTISQELSNCNYGIVCLTTDNITAPWINFEAGAIAKSLDSKVTALMINVKPSDIKGPLSRYQATKIDKDDFLKLMDSINKSLDTPLNHNVLENAFNAIWTSVEEDITSIIKSYSNKIDVENAVVEKKEQRDNEPLEEILQLLRTQNSLMSNPEALLPIEYIDYVSRRIVEKNHILYANNEMIIDEIMGYLDNVVKRLDVIPKCASEAECLEMIHFEELFQIVLHNCSQKRNKRFYSYVRHLQNEYIEKIKSQRNITTETDGTSLKVRVIKQE